MYCIIANRFERNLLKVQYKEKKNILTGLFLHSLFVMVRCVLIICGHVLHFVFQNDLC